MSLNTTVPLATSQTWAVRLDQLPVTIRLPSAERAITEKIASLCPLNATSSSLLTASHTLAVPSSLPVTIRWLSGEKATELISPEWPLRVNSSLPLAASQTLAV